MKFWWWKYYIFSFILLLLLSFTFSLFIPSTFIAEVSEILIIFTIWYLISPLIMIYSFRMKKNENLDLEKIVEYTSSLLKMKKPIVFISYTNTANAFAFGNIFYKAIAFTSGISDALQPNELIGVTAHEISHLKNHDMEIQVLGLISYSILYIYLSNISYIFSTVIFITAFPLFILVHRFLEKRADITAVKDNRWITVYLESALIKIGYLGKTIPNYLLKEVPDFQIYFIKQQLIGSYKENSIFKTHPPIAERLRYLSKYEVS